MLKVCEGLLSLCVILKKRVSVGERMIKVSWLEKRKRAAMKTGSREEKQYGGGGGFTTTVDESF